MNAAFFASLPLVQVNGLYKRIKEDDLFRIFQSCGTIADIKIVRNEERNATGAFLTFLREMDAQLAVTLNNKVVVMNRPLRIEVGPRASLTRSTA